MNQTRRQTLLGLGTLLGYLLGRPWLTGQASAAGLMPTLNPDSDPDLLSSADLPSISGTEFVVEAHEAGADEEVYESYEFDRDPDLYIRPAGELPAELTLRLTSQGEVRCSLGPGLFVEPEQVTVLAGGQEALVVLQLLSAPPLDTARSWDLNDNIPTLRCLSHNLGPCWANLSYRPLAKRLAVDRADAHRRDKVPAELVQLTFPLQAPEVFYSEVSHPLHLSQCSTHCYWFAARSHVPLLAMRVSLTEYGLFGQAKEASRTSLTKNLVLHRDGTLRYSHGVLSKCEDQYLWEVQNHQSILNTFLQMLSARRGSADSGLPIVGWDQVLLWFAPALAFAQEQTRQDRLAGRDVVDLREAQAMAQLRALQTLVPQARHDDCRGYWPYWDEAALDKDGVDRHPPEVVARLVG